MRGYIGIDPGVSKGCAALITENGQYFLHDWKDEKTAVVVLKAWGAEYDLTAAVEQIFSAMTAIEKRNSKSRYFGNSRTMENYGFWRGALTALDIRFAAVHPRTWQSRILIKSAGKSTKQRAFNTVRELFPGVRDSIRLISKHDGRADAFLIAALLKREVEFENRCKGAV